MFRTRVLTLLWLFVPLVNCFNWDIVVGEDQRLQFYYNGTLTHTEDIPSASSIISVTYDPVHYRVLFADFHYTTTTTFISSFDLSTRKIHHLLTREYNDEVIFVYDPVTQLIFCKTGTVIYSLNPASSNKTDNVNGLVTLDHNCWDLAVDVYGRYIYWVTDYEVERARFDGSEREVLRNSHVYNRGSLAIDQQTQKMYWTETINVNGDYQLSIESANLNGENRTTLHTIRNVEYGFSLAVSKDFIYWKNYQQVGIWQLPKLQSQYVEGKLFSTSPSYCMACQNIVANYTIKEQIQGTKTSETLQSLLPNDSKPESSVSICRNYCFQGDCSVSADGQPTCSCEAGFSGERCEVNACHKHCLNNGVCYLNEEDEAVCECTADYEGARCNVATTCTGVHAENTTPQVLRDLYSAVKQVIKEELEHTLQFYSDKIDENKAQIQKCENSILDVKKRCTGLQYYDETTSKTQTSN